MLAKLLRRFLSKSDPATLYISFTELPNPRGWGTLDFAVGRRLIFSTDVNLVANSLDVIEALIGQHWQAIQGSGYQRIAYRNVADWLQERIEQKLHWVGAAADGPSGQIVRLPAHSRMCLRVDISEY